MKDIAYEWKKGFQCPVAAQKAGERVYQLKQKHGGRITAKLLVKDAENKRSPLHVAFEWDTKAAAEKYRISQAGGILRSLVITLETTGEEEPERVRAFVVVKSAPKEDADRGYIDIKTAMNDPVLRDELLQQAKHEFEALRDKYRLFKELADFVKQLGNAW